MIRNNSANFKKVAIIILNYNSWQDTIDCATLLLKQNWPDFIVIVVDNSSSDGSVEKMKAEWTLRGDIRYVAEYQKDEAEDGGIAEREKELERYGSREKLVLIKNDKNLGYSAGNNVGIRYAIRKNADAVLIVNPDVRVEDTSSLQKMADVMFSNDSIYIVGPNIIDAEGNRQSPLKEPGFFKEIINPFVSAFLKKLFGKPLNYLESIKSDKPYGVEKVSGACLIIKISFLKEIGLLDENVFLYCEEPILMYMVQEYNGKIIYIPTVFVKHLHQEKEENVFKYRQFIKSRLYFLSKYKRYNFLKIALIKTSYSLVLLSKMLRSLGKRSSFMP
jgi:GT2 family glycosyltransferase